MNRKAWRVATSLALTLALVLELVPRPALAEAIEETLFEDVEESSELLLDEGEALEPMAEEAEASLAPSDESQPEDVAADATLAAAHDTVDEEPVASLPADEGTTDDADVQDADAQEADAQDKPLELAPAAEENVLTLDQPVAVTAEEGGHWQGSFTAPAAGAYTFLSMGSSDPYCFLYGDASGQNYLDSDGWSGGGNNFRMTRDLDGGQTVWLSINGANGEAITTTILVSTKTPLADTDLSFDKSTFIYDGSAHAPAASIYNWNVSESPLAEGTDYKFDHYLDANGNQLPSSPSACGRYTAVYQGLGSYFGTKTGEFTIADAKDLSYGELSLDVSSFPVTGEPVTLSPKVKDAEGNVVDSSAYTLKYSYDYEAIDLFDEVPSEIGSYYAFAVAKDGSGYTGTTPYCWFRIYDSKDLSNWSLEADGYEVPITETDLPGSLNTKVSDDYSDAVLTLGVDYELAYRDAEGNDLDAAPSTPGEYEVYGKAIEGSGYTGYTSNDWFRLYDPADISSFRPVVDGAVCSQYVEGIGDFPVFLFDGSPVTPEISLEPQYEGLGEPVEGIDYTITYANNAAPTKEGSFGTATISGKGDRHGEVVVRFLIQDSIDAGDYAVHNHPYVHQGARTDQYGYDGTTLNYLAEGSTVAPTVSFEDFDAYDYWNWSFDTLFSFNCNGDRTPKMGKDFTISYVDADGRAVANPKEVGSYSIRVTGVDGGMLTGSLDIPFSIVDKASLADAGLSLTSDGAHIVDDDGWHSFTIHGVVDDLSNFAWSLWTDGKALIENLDYTVSSVLDTVDSFFDVLFTGIGSYEGSSAKARVNVDATLQDAFENMPVVRNYVYSTTPLVFVGENNAIEEPTTRLANLSLGTDYQIDGVYDADGKAITEAEPGSEVQIKLVGMGDYEGCERFVDAKVAAGSDSFDLSATDEDENYVGVSVGEGGNAWITFDDDKNEEVIHLLKSDSTDVRLQVYGDSGLVFNEGNGITVDKQVSADGKSMKVTVAPDANNPLLTSSKTITVMLEDSYSLESIADSLMVAGYDGIETAYENVTDGSVELGYAGFEYSPDAFFACNANPSFDTTLLDASGKVVNAITGAGSYTIKLTGTGDWTGAAEASLKVRSVPSRLDINQCRVELGAANLVKGVAEPEVTVSFMGHTFKEGTDYTVAYGSNTTPGASGWAKITTTDTGLLSGTYAESFIVSNGSASKDLASGRFGIGLENPSGDGRFIEADNSSLLVYALAGKNTGPAIEVYEYSNGVSEVSEDCYDVTYGNMDQPGVAFVKVTGKGDYSGSLAANFYVLKTDKTSIADAVVTVPDQTYAAETLEPAVTVKLDSETLKFGTDYTVTYQDNVNAGTAMVSVSGTGDYTGTKKATFAIAKATATVAADDAGKTFGEDDPELTATVTGLKGTDTLDYTVSRAAGEDAGTYAITVTAKESANYTVTTKAGTFTVSPKPQTVPETVEPEVKENEDGSVTTQIDTLAINLAPTKAEDKNYEPRELVVDDYKLVEGTDYDVEYVYDPEGTTGVATFTFKGNYSGAVTVEFPQPEYEIIEQSAPAWTAGSEETLSIRCNGNYEKFQKSDIGVKVDGKIVDPDNYDVTEGSTIVTFKAAFLSTLGAGDHSVAVYYPDGKATTSFAVEGTSDEDPKEDSDDKTDEGKSDAGTADDGKADTGKKDSGTTGSAATTKKASSSKSSSSKSGKSGKSTMPGTGDDTRSPLWALTLGISALGAGLVLDVDRRKRAQR